MGFPRQEYWSGLPFPSPGDLPNPGTGLASPALAGRFFATEPPLMPDISVTEYKMTSSHASVFLNSVICNKFLKYEHSINNSDNIY